MDKTTFALEIEWDVPNLPSLVGPFETRAEARHWAALNIPNGSWNVAPMNYPYRVSRERSSVPRVGEPTGRAFGA